VSASDRRELIRSVQELLRAQRWAEALPLLDRCARDLPGQWQVWQWRAGCLAQLGRLAEALGSARRAAELAPDQEKAASLVRSLEARLAAATGPIRPPRPTGAGGPGQVDPYSTGRFTVEPEASRTGRAPDADYRTVAEGPDADYRTLVDAPDPAVDGAASTLADHGQADEPAVEATMVEPGAADQPTPRRPSPSPPGPTGRRPIQDGTTAVSRVAGGRPRHPGRGRSGARRGRGRGAPAHPRRGGRRALRGSRQRPGRHGRGELRARPGARPRPRHQDAAPSRADDRGRASPFPP